MCGVCVCVVVELWGGTNNRIEHLLGYRRVRNLKYLLR
jgi:hypothetical protein